jgi:hypothetical protein
VNRSSGSSQNGGADHFFGIVTGMTLDQGEGPPVLNARTL